MASLPKKFERLEGYVDTWALPTELERSRQRWRATEVEYQQFYDAMLPVLDEVLAYLDQYQLGSIPDAALPLYHLALAYAEAAPHVELYECSNKVPNSFDAARFIAAHGEQPDC